MNILVINPILYTTYKNIINRVESIKDTMIYNMCTGFKILGHNVTLCTTADFAPNRDEQYDIEVKFFEANLKKIFIPTLLPYTRLLMKFLELNYGKYDMILASETFSIGTLMAALVCPEKLVIWQEMTLHQRKFFKLPSKIWHNVVVKLFMKKVAVVVPRSEYAYEFISQYMKQTSDVVVDHGVNIEKFKTSTEKSRQIISSSRLVPSKNVDYSIKVFKKLHSIPKYSDIRLIIAGNGCEEQNLRNLVESLELSQYVDFVGFLPQHELNTYISKSLCFLVNTSLDLNMVSIPEAIVSGTPILTNSLPATSRFINEKQVGVVKDNWDYPELVNIIDNNERFVENCIKCSSLLTHTHSAQMLINALVETSEKGN